MMLKEFKLVSALKILTVATVAGTAAFMFIPFVAAGPMTSFAAAFSGVAISLPLILYFLKVPDQPFNFGGYWSERHLPGTLLDLVMTLLVAMAPGIIVLYALLDYGVFDPVPVASSTAVAVFTGYSAFLYRNRAFYSEEKIDIEV